MDKFPRKRSAFRVWIEGRNKELQNYIANRKINYPEIGEQLDLLYHAIDADSDLKTKFSSFYDTIKSIKGKYPKPS